MIKLTSSNYFLWKTMMEDHLYCNDLTLPIECKGIKPDDMDDAKWNGLNRKATANVRKWVSSKSINHISQEHDCYTVWKLLEETFAKAMKEPAFIKGMKEDLRLPIVHRNQKELADYTIYNYEVYAKYLKEMGLIK